MALPRHSPPFLGRRAALHPTVTFYLEHVGRGPLIIPQPRFRITQVVVCDLLAHHSCRQPVLPVAQKCLPQKHYYVLAPYLLCFLVLVCYHRRRMQDMEPTGPVCAPTQFLILPDNTGWMSTALFAAWFAGTTGSEVDFCNERKTLEHICSQCPGFYTSPQPFSSPADALAVLFPSAFHHPWQLPGVRAQEQREVLRGLSGQGLVAIPIPLPQPGAGQLVGMDLGLWTPPWGQETSRPCQEVSLQVGSGSSLGRGTRARCSLGVS